VAPDVRAQFSFHFCGHDGASLLENTPPKLTKIEIKTTALGIFQADALGISMKEHLGRRVERASGSFFQRIFENALQIVAPFFHAFFKTL